jgi:hypothetical protein
MPTFFFGAESEAIIEELVARLHASGPQVTTNPASRKHLPSNQSQVEDNQNGSAVPEIEAPDWALNDRL